MESQKSGTYGWFIFGKPNDDAIGGDTHDLDRGFWVGLGDVWEDNIEQLVRGQRGIGGCCRWDTGSWGYGVRYGPCTGRFV